MIKNKTVKTIRMLETVGHFKCGMNNEESHTCEEGGAHLSISLWHLLMNLKNN